MSVFKKTTVALLAASVVVGTFGTAFADDRGGRNAGGPGAMPRFETADANSDGSVTFDEFVVPLTERFEQADADKNGSVNADEIIKAMDSRRAERMASRLIERFDIDGNGEVTKAELENRQRKMFALLDLDDSGAISKDELPKRMGRGGDRDDRGRGEGRGERRGGDRW